MSRDAKGILGETFVPTRGSDGKAIMTGMEAIRGQQDDCEFLSSFCLYCAGGVVPRRAQTLSHAFIWEDRLQRQHCPATFGVFFGRLLSLAYVRL